MGWGQHVREPLRSRLNWANAELNTAAAVSAAQLPVAAAVWWLGTLGDDDHGVTYSGLFAVGALCMLVLGPPVLAVLGLLHTAAHTLPAASLANLVARRVRGPEWAWHLVFVGVLGALWAAVVAVLGGWSFLVAALLVTGAGVLPAVGVVRVRRWERIMGRPPRSRGLWLWSGLASFGVSVLVVAAGAAAFATGLLKEYEPPKLSDAQLAGVWRGADGAVLKLGDDRRAELTGLPYTAEGDDWPGAKKCGGTGSWARGHDDSYARDTVRLSVDRCGDATWTIGGTEDAPELFVLIGDSDAPDIRILKRD